MPLTPENSLDKDRTGGWVGLSASLDDSGEEKNILVLLGFKLRTVQAVASSYTDWNIKAHMNIG